jgi:hypothetical protein
LSILPSGASAWKTIQLDKKLEAVIAERNHVNTINTMKLTAAINERDEFKAKLRQINEIISVNSFDLTANE